ncbi:MAG: hypothetical protein Q8L87_09970 [Anaerolineales bacterium]|nr:hypothetical protein [Anaerolineales bacterium]
MTTSFLLPPLCELTEKFCSEQKIPTKKFGAKYDHRSLPENPFSSGLPVVLVPRDLLRDLPLAADWADVSRVVMEIDEIRDAVNRMFGDFAKATVSEKKAAVRKVAFQSLENFRLILRAIADASESYDEKADLDGFYLFRDILNSNPQRFSGLVVAPSAKTQGSLRGVVEEIVRQFKELVENNNLWELLWFGTSPRHERASQLLFFAVSNMICFVNNTDISPETNSGGGPVDFKFSTGFSGRFLVEIKLSTGKVVHGYSKQLEIYKSAANTAEAVFLVINVGKMGKKIQTIQKIRQKALDAGQPASEIVVIDARRRRSASRA